MNTCSNYNQIHMYEKDGDKIIFMVEQANYQYNIMPYVLKNIRFMYQRVMNKIFKEEIGETLEVYMDVMIVKSSKEE